MFVCGEKPSRTGATSRRYMVELPTTFTGRSFNLSTRRGLELRSTSYSNWSILTVPDGNTRFCRDKALTTSVADSPFDCSNEGLRSTMICRCLPPYGYGMEAPGTVTNCVLRKLSPTSLRSASERPDSANCRIGTEEALKLKIKGGWVPCGSWR